MAERKRKPNNPEVVYRANKKFVSTHYDRIEIQVPSGMRERLKEYAQEAGSRSLQQWISGILERETGLDLVLRGEFGPQAKPKEDSNEGEAE